MFGDIDMKMTPEDVEPLLEASERLVAETNLNFRVFFRMRKRHLLPALHDGMQGDEDGMQTCERPPLWAFGWPRGGVHMFTSLHVACLARVA